MNIQTPAPRPITTTRGALPRARPQRCEPLLPAAVARGIGFAGLATFGALQWARMVEPAASGRLLMCVLAALAAAALLVRLGRPGDGAASARVRAAATVAVGAALLVLAFLEAGVPVGLLDPRAWGELAAAIGQGLATVPTVRVPYSGLEEWTRIVIVLGGGVLVGAAAVLAFAPVRRGGAGFGFPVAAAVLLATLYAVPIIQRETEHQFLAGTGFALLVALFLWLERVERRAAPLAAAAVATAALAALAAAPGVDGERALLDYEELAQSLSPATTTNYDWNHAYGPLDWPRDGREVLRIRAPQRAYWKAMNLTAFDGLRWVQLPQDVMPLDTPLEVPAWRQEIRVTLRALESTQFVAAGTTLDILRSPRREARIAPGVFETLGQPLRRGHAYDARVYTPRPTAAALRAAGTAYPPQFDADYSNVRLPGQTTLRGILADVPFWGQTDRTSPGTHVSADELLRGSAYERTYALARRLREGTSSPYEYMRAIERYLERGFEYSEEPPPATYPLQDFLLRDRIGYCQHFSGAMVLLLRLGGVPARVAAGFSPGVRDEERGEYVVRDIDAHSWVEVYFPGIGWVVRDPTPPDSPARAQVTDVSATGDAPVTFGGSERALEAAAAGPVAGGGVDGAGADGSSPPAGLIAGGVATLVLALVAVVLLIRRRRRAPAGEDAQVAELRRALERSGRPPPPPMTLEALALRFAGTPAEGYVRELVAARYGYGAAAPSAGQRAALRRELGAGLGLRGRLRAWWALPPRRTGRSVHRRPAE